MDIYLHRNYFMADAKPIPVWSSADFITVRRDVEKLLKNNDDSIRITIERGTTSGDDYASGNFKVTIYAEVNGKEMGKKVALMSDSALSSLLDLNVHVRGAPLGDNLRHSYNSETPLYDRLVIQIDKPTVDSLRGIADVSRKQSFYSPALDGVRMTLVHPSGREEQLDAKRFNLQLVQAQPKVPEEPKRKKAVA